MSEELQAPQVAAEPVAPAAEAPQFDPAEIEQLRQFKAQVEPVLETLRPYGDDIQRLVQDEEARNFYRQSLKTYEQLRAEQAPKVDPALQPVFEELKPVKDWISQQQTREAEAAKTAQQEAANAQWSKVQEASKELPWLAQDNYRAAFEVAQFGDLRGIKDFGDALSAYRQEMASRFGAPVVSAPPRSLRGDAGDPGVPGPKPAAKINGPQDIKARLAASLRAQQRAV